MRKKISIGGLVLAAGLFAQHVVFLGTNGKVTWAKLGSTVAVNATVPYPTLECVVPPSVPRAPVTYTFPVVAGQTTYAIPASEPSNPRWLLVTYAVVLVEGEDYTVSADKRTVTFTKTAPTPGGTVQITAVF